MHDANQAPPPGSSPSTPTAGPPAASDPREPLPTDPSSTPGGIDWQTPIGPPRSPDERGLVFWLVVVALALPLSLFLNQAELGLFAAIGGLFAIAHAVDRDPRWRLLHYFVAWIPPAGGALLFIGLAHFFRSTDLAPHERLTGLALSLAAAALSLGLVARPLSDRLARWLFRTATPGHTARLGARLVAISFLVCVPGWLAAKALMEASALDNLAIGAQSLAGSLVGFVVLSLGAVGFLVGRGPRAAAARLGLSPLRAADWLVIVAALIAVVLLNNGVEWVASSWFPDLMARDEAMNRVIAGHLSRRETIFLGVSAGLGEELAMRGALQPRLGLVLTSLLFASLHVQYSWLGMATIAVIGMTLGVVRQRTSTTAAIVVHVLYDILAAFGVQQGV